MTDLQARAEAAADMRRTARELRENVGRDSSAVMEALQWEEKAAAIEAAIVEHLSRELDITNADHIALWLEANMNDSTLGWLACRIIEAHEQALALHALQSEGWRPIGEAPRDGTIIWAIFRNGLEGHMSEHWSGIQVSIRHEGVTVSDYDLGWSVMRAGFGGLPDHYFAGWRHLPAPPEGEGV